MARARVNSKHRLNMAANGGERNVDGGECTADAVRFIFFIHPGFFQRRIVEKKTAAYVRSERFAFTLFEPMITAKTSRNTCSRLQNVIIGVPHSYSDRRHTRRYANFKKTNAKTFDFHENFFIVRVHRFQGKKVICSSGHCGPIYLY